jgi:hypothetical protein
LREALSLWGGNAEAMCGQHHWPVWGRERIDTMKTTIVDVIEETFPGVFDVTEIVGDKCRDRANGFAQY